MPACRVGCCPDNVCDCSTDCECLLPADEDLSGRFGFENPRVFQVPFEDDLKKSPNICPCKAKYEISNRGTQLEERSVNERNRDLSSEERSSGVKKNCRGVSNTEDCCSKENKAKSAGHLLANGVEGKTGHRHENGVDHRGDVIKHNCCENKGCDVECRVPAKTPPPNTCSNENLLRGRQNEAKANSCCGEKEGVPKKSCCSSKGNHKPCDSPSKTPPVTTHSHDGKLTPGHNEAKKCCSENGASKKSLCSSKGDIKPCGNDDSLPRIPPPKIPPPKTSSHDGNLMPGHNAKAKSCCSEKEGAPKKSCCSSNEGDKPCGNGAPPVKTCSPEKVTHGHHNAKAKSCSNEKEGAPKKICCSSKEGDKPCGNGAPPVKTCSPEKVTHGHHNAKAKSCCSEKEGAPKKSCCSSKEGDKPCGNGAPPAKTCSPEKVTHGHHHNAKAKSCCSEKEGSPKKICCSSKEGDKPCGNGAPPAKTCSSEKVTHDHHHNANANTCCSEKEEGTPKKSCCSSKEGTKPCGNGGPLATTIPPKVKKTTFNVPETKTSDEREAVPETHAKPGVVGRPSFPFDEKRRVRNNIINQRKQSYPFDEKRRARNRLDERKQSYPFYEIISRECGVDPHHGHEHHHKHEYHHEGGHHHHDHHHDDDHDHDEHNHGDHHHHHDDHHHGDQHHGDQHHGDHHSHSHHRHGDHSNHDHRAGHDNAVAECHSNDHHDCGHDHHDDHDHTSSCDALGSCDNTCNRKSCCEVSDCDSRSESSCSGEERKPLVTPDAKVVIDEFRVQTTKLRVQNMCCPKESRIVDEELRKLQGINKIRVNVIGRVVYVTHNPDVVSPTELMVTLNRRHLGVSIVDTGAEEAVETGLPKSLKILLGILAVQAVLFAVALAAMFSSVTWYMWLAIVEICFGIFPVLKKSFYAIRNREIDLNILITITVIGTLVIEEWIEGAAVVFVFTLANFLQQFCFYRVHKTISSLMLSKPTKAVMACTGDCIPIEQVPVGSIIAVRQGELIPLDGIVVKGSASVDESSISGEAAPVEKTLKSQTYSGTVIQHGYLELETTSSSTSSTISKISAMVEDAQMNVSPTEMMVNKFARYYTPLVVILAALVFLFPLVLGFSGVAAYEGRTKTWGERALIVLVTACPCALLMATPIVVICGISGGARLGTLIKGGTFLEALAQLTFLAFDKTGTLTEGKFQVVDLLPVDKGEECEVLRWAAALESKSSHPLAAAVVSEFTGECVADFADDAEELLLPDVTGFRTTEGQGISGVVEGHYIEIGNQSLLTKIGVTLSPKFETAYIAFCADSKTVVFVCVDGELALIISLADIIRWESCAALEWLQDLGVHVAMLTGDSRQTANAVQKELKIDSCISEMKPDDKLNWIGGIKEEQVLKKRSCFRGKRVHVVGMVGDGVNDGPALAAADVGIAMAAGGSALAVEAAGVALMTNSVLKVPEMICLSRFCRRLIIQNITLAVVLKLVFVVVALTGFVRVWMAVLADLVGLVAVILNGLRPLKWEPPKSKVQKRVVPRASWRRKRPVLQYESVV